MRNTIRVIVAPFASTGVEMNVQAFVRFRGVMKAGHATQSGRYAD